MSINDIIPSSTNGPDGLIFTETTDNGITSYIVSGYKGSSKDVVIPSSYHSIKVVKIGDEAIVFGPLTSVTIPNSVTHIGVRAFAFNELTSITIPNSVTDIGVRAFAWNRLTSVTIPSSVISMGAYVFTENWNLQTIYIEHAEQPDGWDDDWAPYCVDVDIIWGYQINSSES